MAVVTKTKSKEDGACKKCPPAHAKLCTSFEAMCGRAQGFVDEETQGIEDLMFGNEEIPRFRGKPKNKGSLYYEKNFSSLEKGFGDGSGDTYNEATDLVSYEECRDRFDTLECVNTKHDLQMYWDYRKGEFTWEELAEMYGYNSVASAQSAYHQFKSVVEKAEELYYLLKYAKPLNEAAKAKKALPAWLRDLLLANCFPDIPTAQLARYLGEEGDSFHTNVQYGLRKIRQGDGIRLHEEDGVICVGETKRGSSRVEIPLRPDLQTQISMN